MDFNSYIPPISISTSTTTSSGAAMAFHQTALGLASFNWTANLAAYIPITIPWRFPVKRVFWINGTSVASNVDMGVYSPDGAKLFSTGSTGQSGASLYQYVAADYILEPGSYYFAISTNGSTNAFLGMTNVDTIFGRFNGLRQQATAFALPATATFAQWATTGVPICGISRAASGL